MHAVVQYQAFVNKSRIASRSERLIHVVLENSVTQRKFLLAQFHRCQRQNILLQLYR